MKKNIRIKKREITSLFQNFAWETMPYRESLEYLQNIEKQLLDYYANYRVPLR